jgi:hypothetical protein
MNISVLPMQFEQKPFSFIPSGIFHQKNLFYLGFWVFAFLLATSQGHTQPIELKSQDIEGLLESRIANHQGHRFAEALIEELLQPNLYPIQTQLTQRGGPFVGLPLTIEYSSFSNQDLAEIPRTQFTSLPIFLDQMIIVTLTSTDSALERSFAYQVVVPLETPKIFWPVIEDLNTSRSILFVPDLDTGWESLRNLQAASLVTSVQSLLTWFIGMDCSKLESFEISSFGPVAQGHFISTHPQLITLLNLGLRLAGTNGIIEELGNQFFSYPESPCIQQIPPQFFVRY